MLKKSLVKTQSRSARCSPFHSLIYHHAEAEHLSAVSKLYRQIHVVLAASRPQLQPDMSSFALKALLQSMLLTSLVWSYAYQPR